MAYQRQNLKDGDCLCAHNLHKMEDALCDMPCVEKARAGQVLAVAEVDETGKPKRYEAVNMDIPETGGAEEIYIGETEPTDENIKIWVDPNDNEKIPLSSFENDMGFITEEDIPSVPTKTSDLQNDSGFITADDIPEGGVQPDMAQNDPDAADYVKNRTHWVEPLEVVTVPEQTLPLEGGQGMITDYSESVFVVNDLYEVTYNGTVYECTAFEFNGFGAIGNPIAGGLEDNGMPFFMAIIDGMFAVIDFTGAESVLLKVIHKGEIVHKIHNKFVDNQIVVANFADSGDSNYLLLNMTVDEVFAAYEAGKYLVAKITVMNELGVVYRYFNMCTRSIIADDSANVEVDTISFVSFMATTLNVAELVLHRDGRTSYTETQLAKKT